MKFLVLLLVVAIISLAPVFNPIHLKAATTLPTRNSFMSGYPFGRLLGTLDANNDFKNGSSYHPTCEDHGLGQKTSAPEYCVGLKFGYDTEWRSLGGVMHTSTNPPSIPIVTIPENMHKCISLVVSTYGLSIGLNASLGQNGNISKATDDTVRSVEGCILHPERLFK